MINVTIHTDGDPKDIEPDAVEDALNAIGLDVFLVDVTHVENVTDTFYGVVS